MATIPERCPTRYSSQVAELPSRSTYPADMRRSRWGRPLSLTAGLVVFVASNLPAWQQHLVSYGRFAYAPPNSTTRYAPAYPPADRRPADGLRVSRHLAVLLALLPTVKRHRTGANPFSASASSTRA